MHSVWFLGEVTARQFFFRDLLAFTGSKQNMGGQTVKKIYQGSWKGVGQGGGGAIIPSPDFGRSVNPIPTRVSRQIILTTALLLAPQIFGPYIVSVYDNDLIFYTLAHPAILPTHLLHPCIMTGPPKLHTFRHHWAICRSPPLRPAKHENEFYTRHALVFSFFYFIFIASLFLWK